MEAEDENDKNGEVQDISNQQITQEIAVKDILSGEVEVEEEDSKEQDAVEQTHENAIYEAQICNKTVYHKGEHGERLMNEYELLEKLGRGAFGKVKKVKRRFLGEDGVTILSGFYAAKIMNKNQLEYERVMIYGTADNSCEMSNRLALQYAEIDIYKHLNHPNICKLYSLIDDETDEKMYMIMEYCDIGQLMTWDEDTQIYNPNIALDTFIAANYNIRSHEEVNSQHGNGCFREQLAKVIFKQVSEAVLYLHEQDIVNRDIKIENILCCSNEEVNYHIKLADFSTVKKLKRVQHIQESQNNKEIAGELYRLKDCSGTSGFRCPEMQFNLDEGYDGKAADIWSLGISILTYVNYKIPFWSESSNLETDINAKNNPLPFETDNSPVLRDLIEKMCAKEEANRPTIAQVLAHQFFENTVL